MGPKPSTRNLSGVSSDPGKSKATSSPAVPALSVTGKGPLLSRSPRGGRVYASEADHQEALSNFVSVVNASVAKACVAKGSVAKKISQDQKKKPNQWEDAKIRK